MADKDLSVVEEHAVDGLDGSVGSLGGLVVDESVASGRSRLIDSDLARENVSESGERVVEGLIYARNT